MNQILQLPLHPQHAEKGAKFGTFGTWEVPLYYTSVLEEHHLVRSKAGLFDISHMGEFLVEGKNALAFLNRLVPRDISKSEDGQALYTMFLNPEGGIIDDIIIYRYHAEKFLLIVNAGNVETDWQWVKAAAEHEDVHVENITNQKGLLALQGPLSASLLDRFLAGDISKNLKYYRFWDSCGMLIARTGYTGEDGFEIMVDQADLTRVWDELLNLGKKDGLAPVGFGARDTLRLEAGMPLHGSDITAETTPLEAGLGWTLNLEKKEFVGKNILEEQKRKGVKKKLIGFEMTERGIPRHGYPVFKNGREIGQVTSGSFSPTLKKNIGLAYVCPEALESDQTVQIKIREQLAAARIATLPFYKRKK